MQDDETREADSDSVDDREQKESVADAIQEARFTTQRKKVRRIMVEDAKDKAQVVPFAINFPEIPSREISDPRLRVPDPERWRIEPREIELSSISASSDLELPLLRIWEEALLEPLIDSVKTISSPEIGLPPRPLLSMTGNGEKSNAITDLVKNGDVDSSVDAVRESPEEVPFKQIAEQEDEVGRQGEARLLGLDEFLFEISGGSLSSYDPLCIVAAKTPEEEYQQTLQTLCREQFQQLQGGKPLANLLAKGEEQELETARVENHLFSYDDDESNEEFFEFNSHLIRDATKTFEGGEADLSKLHHRIDEFFTQTLGYLLLFVSEEYASTLYDHLMSTDEIREPTQIRFVRPRLLPEDVKRELVQLAWGGAPIELTSGQLDRLFQTAEAEFKDLLRPDDPVVEVTAHDVGNESVLHYWVKCLVVEWLLKQEGLTPIKEQSRVGLKEMIPTEIQLEGGQNPIPDVYHKPSREVFEVETLYGTHHKKITRTIDKYEGVNVKRVNVVLPNLTLLRNLSAVLGKTQAEPGEMFKNEVQFWTLDVANRELIPLDEVISRLTDLQTRAEKFW